MGSQSGVYFPQCSNTRGQTERLSQHTVQMLTMFYKNLNTRHHSDMQYTKQTPGLLHQINPLFITD